MHENVIELFEDCRGRATHALTNKAQLLSNPYDAFGSMTLFKNSAKCHRTFSKGGRWNPLRLQKDGEIA